MKRLSPARIVSLGSIFWLVVLGCRTGDLIARANPTATRTVTRTLPRPTFTPAPPTALPTIPPPPPPPPPTATPTRAPTARRTPTRVPTVAKSPTPAPPPPTADPDVGWYYKRVFKGCSTSTSPNTRIEGTVYDYGLKKNGVTVRLSHGEHLEALIPDFVTGVDPNDYKHLAPERQGMYRLSPAEGGYVDGNWWVFVVGSDGNPLSKGQYIKTHDGPGCNIAIVDFVH